MASRSRPTEIAAIKVTQWLPEWDRVVFDDSERRRRPDPFFYVFSMAAGDLRALTGIQRRTTEGRTLGQTDTGIERPHDEDRSRTISRFIRWGYPWSEMRESQRISGRFDDLRKPGWLPTAIVVNVLRAEDEDLRRGLVVDDDDYIRIEENGTREAVVHLPAGFTGSEWTPQKLPPIEVIDGQHRLWAIGDGFVPQEYELPVVAFYGLDVSWQAYLFWTINIKPKKINASLAFGLYPLLRTEEWLERFEGPAIYREARAQELTQVLWGYSFSPWYRHINMLGETGMKPMVRQSAWIRSLIASYVKAFEGRRISVGGLFGAKIGRDREALNWSGAQQAAFLIVMGRKLHQAIAESYEPWAESLRDAHDAWLQDNPLEPDPLEGKEPAFYGQHTLLNQDQGIRGALHITNDLCFVEADELRLDEWARQHYASSSDEEAVTAAAEELEQLPAGRFLERIAQSLASYDWRTSSAPGLSDQERTVKAAFRGSGGYKVLRIQLLRHVVDQGDALATTAASVAEKLGYDPA